MEDGGRMTEGLEGGSEEGWSEDPIGALETTRIRLLESARVLPGVETVVEPNVAYGSTGLPFAPFNSVAGARFGDDADARIEEIVDWYRQRGMPFSWWLGPRDQPQDLGRRLEAHGLERDEETVPGMALDLRRPLAEAPGPAGLTIERVRDEASFEKVVEVVIAAFGGPGWLRDGLRRFALLGFADGNPQRTYVAHLDGRPVGTSLGFHAGSTLGIYNVAVLPDARGLGIGGAVTRAALQAGADDGCRIAVLESTALGHPIYERLGFRDVAEYRVYCSATAPGDAPPG